MFWLIQLVIAFTCEKEIDLISSKLSRVSSLEEKIALLEKYVSNQLPYLEPKSFMADQYFSFLECQQLFEDWVEQIKKKNAIQKQNSLQLTSANSAGIAKGLSLQSEKGVETRNQKISADVCEAFVERWGFRYQSEKIATLVTFKKKILVYFCP